MRSRISRKRVENPNILSEPALMELSGPPGYKDGANLKSMDKRIRLCYPDFPFCMKLPSIMQAKWGSAPHVFPERVLKFSALHVTTS
jgi:hypothetical protein